MSPTIGRTLPILLLCLISLDSHAFVNMRNGNYSQSWTDIQSEGAGMDLSVRRIYNSRTAYSGMFGRGWCSPFETRVDELPDGTLRSTECGAGEQTLFRPDASRQSGVFYARGKEFETLIKTGTGYVRTHQDRFQDVFDASGRLVRMQDANGNFSEMTYRNGRLEHVGWSDQRALDFSYGENGKVELATSSTGQKASYRYDGDLLVSGKNGWENLYVYEYDARKRMARATWPDGTFIAIEYDPKHNWVAQFTRRNGCRENYQYLSDAAKHESTKLTRHCPDDNKPQDNSSAEQDAPASEVRPSPEPHSSPDDVSTSAAEFDYWYATNAQGERYLERIRSNILGKERDVRYHGTFRLPLSIAINNDDTRYEYYPSGLVKSRATQYLRLSYEYERSKISKVTQQSFDESGKQIARQNTDFAYDEHGNVKSVSNSESQRIGLKYDRLGHIVKMTNQARHILTLTYDKRCGKPETVRVRRLGGITVRYNAKCEIDKVDSKQTPAVAMQVASMFNNLLEILAPASMEMYP